MSNRPVPESTFQVPTNYPDPHTQNVNTVPLTYAYGQGHPLLDRKPPSVPTGLVLSSKTATSVILDWGISTDENGVDHYNVYRDGTKALERVNSGATVSGLTTKTAYAFTVTAVDKRGNESAKSSTLNVTTS